MAALAATMLCACAGRAPQQLADEKGLKTAQNVAAVVAGFVIPVLWFGMDWQGSQDKEIVALQSRQQYLAVLAEQKRCGVEPEPGPLPRRPQKKSAVERCRSRGEIMKYHVEFQPLRKGRTRPDDDGESSAAHKFDTTAHELELLPNIGDHVSLQGNHSRTENDYTTFRVKVKS